MKDGSGKRFIGVDELRLLAPRAAFPVTICVLFYGDHADLSRRFLERLFGFTDPQAFNLRLGMNAVCHETERLVDGIAEKYDNVLIHRSEENIYKCPMMRRLFHQPALESEWTIWFDDDSHVRGPGWILDLGLAMEKLKQVEFFGSLRTVDVSEGLEKFITRGRWYRGVARRAHPADGRPIIIFPVGGFWAVRTERIVQADWPDLRLQHFQTDYTMGEAMRQQGVEIGHFDSGVCIDDAARRGPRDIPYQLRHDY